MLQVWKSFEVDTYVSCKKDEFDHIWGYYCLNCKLHFLISCFIPDKKKPFTGS